MTRYRAPAPDALRILALDDLTAIYHRASGQTHVVAPPVPELLALLAGQALNAGDVLAALAAAYDLPDADEAAVVARLDELVSIGLVERV